MKKIIGAAAAGLVLTGAAFAEYSVTGNVRFESDVFTYTSPSRSTRPDNGDVNWAKDTKHNDDLVFKASGDDVGVQINLAVTSNTNNVENGTVKLTSYRGWANLFGLRLDAGAYDNRLGKNLGNDCDWNKTLSATYKPGFFINIDGAAWGKDASNITAITGNKRTTNFMVTKSGLMDNKLSVLGVLFLDTAGTDANGDSTSNDNWIFTPFAIGAQYKPDKNTVFSLTGKLNSITKGKVNEAKLTYGGRDYYDVGAAKSKANGADFSDMDSFTKDGDYYFDAGNGTANGTGGAGSAGFYDKFTYTGESYTPDKSVYTLNADFYKKLDSGTEIEAAYTLGMSLYSNWSGIAAHKDGNLVRDYDVFAHAFDMRTKTKLTNELTLTAIGSVNYIQGTAVQKRDNNTTPTKQYNSDGSYKGSSSYKDARAKSYATGAAGVLGYWASVSLDYAQSDRITFQLQTQVENSNLFTAAKVASSVTTQNNETHVDYWNKFKWTVRPGVIVSLDKSSVFFAGVNVIFDGFKQNATGSDNTFKTTTSIPVGLRVKL